MTKEEMIGKTFGKLTVIQFDGRTRNYHAKWLCKCECGTIKSIRQGHLISGLTQSCGCYRRNMQVGLKHGKSKTRLYRIWNQMRHRCTDSNHISFPLYGGRGISICDEWLDFEKFQEWSICNGYDDNLVIDRIDTDGNYTSDNCRWVTQKENSNNKRTNVFITIDGVTRTMKEWSEISGVRYETLRNRFLSGYTGHDLFKESVGGVRTRDEKGRYC